MNLTELKAELCEKTGLSSNESAAMLDATIECLKDYAKSLDYVAIPGFGTFSSSKIDEQIIENCNTGQNMLTPPNIKLSFKSSVVLRKKIVG